MVSLLFPVAAPRVRRSRAAGIFALALVPLGLFTLLPAGCSSTSSARSVLQVVEVNENQPLESDVIKLVAGGSATVVEDAVAVQIRNTPHDTAMNLTADGPYGYVVLDRYDVQFEAGDAIPGVGGSLGWTVHTGETITGSLVVVPAALKTEPPLAGLYQGGEIVSIAHVTITGHEATSNHPVSVGFTIQVNFANWEDR